jgi:hypothetical protein
MTTPKKKKTGGRKKGTPNKASRELLYKLEKEHKFFVVPKILALYNEMETMCKPLVDRAIKNAAAGRMPTAGMTPEEVEMINGAQKNRWTILEKLLAYCYPKLRAIELNQATDHDKIIFNISTQGNTKVEKG